MRAPVPYDLVQSLAGHDRGKIFLVIGQQGERLKLCDGRGRPLSRPKVKNPRHVRLVQEGTQLPPTDRQVRQTLAQAAQAVLAEEGKLLGER